MTNDFLAAAIEPSRWLQALSRLADATGSDHAQVIGIGPDYSLDFNWVSAMGPDDHAVFDHDELVSPLTNYRVAAGLDAAPGAVIHEAHYDALKPGLVDDQYLDMCSDMRIPFGCQTNLAADEEGLLGLALLRSQRTGPTTPAVREVFARARADVAAAAALQVAIEREGHRLVAGSFDAMAAPCFVLDRRLAVRATTAAAEALLRDGVVRMADGRVALPRASDDRHLATLMVALAEGRALGGHVTATDGEGIMVLKLHRLPTREWAMGFAPFAILTVKRAVPAATDPGVLRDLYRLTAAESAVAMMLRAGQSREAICAARRISRETLRSHLRSLFAKLGVGREAEAIHLLHTVLG